MPRWVLGLVAIVMIVIVISFFSHHSDGGGNSSPGSSTTSSTFEPTPMTTPTFSESDIESAVIDTCEKSVKKDLRDPDSAKFGDDWKAWRVTNYSTPPPGLTFHPENGDKLYSAGGSVNAKNGFGGYVGDSPYGCDASVADNGDVHAHAYSLEDILNPTPTP